MSAAVEAAGEGRGGEGRGGEGRNAAGPWAVALGASLAGALLVWASACAPPPRMCAEGADCGSASSCVAGRCVARGAVVSISTARRLVFEPVDVGYVRRGGPASGGPASVAAPPVAVLGGEGGGVAFLRFDVRLPPEARVIEAYILLDRAPGVAADPAPIALHLAPVVDGWDSRTLSWALQPRVEEVGAPVTRVVPARAGPVRLDVRSIVERWRRRGEGAGAGGVAVLPAGAAAPGPGVAFALGAMGAGTPGGGEATADGPRLELYIQ